MDKLIDLFKAEIREIKSEQKEDRIRREELEKEQRNRVEDLEKRIQDLETSDKLQNREIESINSVLSEIKDDTKFIRRTVQGGVISTIIGIIVTVVWTTLT